ncbi:dienelactone hydrolase family protein [Hoeflea sp. WL0058]|uniref:Dienelactone hydrolase family protein n=2 Tax=Flavimaribacter sediminis TaxID=2865987 RepID=A0AAE2ZH71_9HYPH|nr:dienelactone hydrolase family protein [Flavimaribacter sediminis]
MKLVLAMLVSVSFARADEAELQRTWDAARVYLPAATPAGFVESGVGDIDARIDPESPPVAVIVYAHGCSGLSRITDTTGRFLAQAGYAVVAPDSFARIDKPKSCDPATHRGGLHRAVLGWRQDEIRHAVEQASLLQSFNDLPVVIMGHSQGAITVATIVDVPAAARIVEGWTCHAGWPEYHGLNSDPDQPVLALVGTLDPWFKSQVLSGDCGAFMSQDNGSRSIVYQKPDYLADKHWLSVDRAVQAEILEFLNRSLTIWRNENAG